MRLEERVEAAAAPVEHELPLVEPQRRAARLVEQEDRRGDRGAPPARTTPAWGTRAAARGATITPRTASIATIGFDPAMRVLVTGGAGFVGANLAVALRRTPSRLGGRRARQPQAARVRAQPAAAARRRRAVRARRRARRRATCSALGRGRRDRRVLGRAVACSPACDGAPDYARARRTCRRVPLPRARAPRRRAGRLPLDQPRLSRRRARRAARSRRPRRASSSPRAADPGPRRPASPRTSRSTGARTLYGATKLAAELLVDRVRAPPSGCRGRSTAAA